MFPTMTNPAVEAWMRHVLAEREEQQKSYKIYREYYEGVHRQQLTFEMRQYLRVRVPGMDFAGNYMPIVVDSVAQRVNVVGFEAGGQEEQIWSWWLANKMPAEQIAAHTSVFRDGDAYVLVDWDAENDRVRITPHMAYDGESGMHIEYDEQYGTPKFAVKYWNQTSDEFGTERRAEAYLPDRILSFRALPHSSNLGWELESTQEWSPAILPVVHFKNRGRGYNYGISEMQQAIPMQDALNKMIIAHIAAAQTSGFRIITWIGNTPGDVEIYPGGILYDPEPDAKISWIQGEDLRPMIETVDSFVQRIGQVSDTPLSYFQLSGQMASEGTHKQHEARLIAKARSATVELGSSWAEVMRIARRVHNTYGPGGMNEEQDISVVWDTLEVRDASQRITDKFERLKLAVDSGANFKAAARLAGFTEEEANDLAEVDYDHVSQAIYGLPETDTGPGNPADQR